jgi:hypothetical protein
LPFLYPPGSGVSFLEQKQSLWNDLDWFTEQTAANVMRLLGFYESQFIRQFSQPTHAVPPAFPFQIRHSIHEEAQAGPEFFRPHW